MSKSPKQRQSAIPNFEMGHGQVICLRPAAPTGRNISAQGKETAKDLSAKVAASTAEALGKSPQNTWNPAGATTLLRPYDKQLLMRAFVSIVSNPVTPHAPRPEPFLPF
jgi:hypothetical protein